MHLARGAALSAAAVLVVSLLALVSPAASAPSVGALDQQAASTTTSKTAGRTAGRTAGKAGYRVKEGVTFNAATGTTAERRAILDHLLRMIRRSRPSGEIKIMTWNYLSSEATDALVKKAKQGTVVRVLIDKRNDRRNSPNPSFRRLKSQLAKISKGKKFSERSIARACSKSCRGNGGAAHAKLFLFSKVGQSRRVVVQGSANLTFASADKQWNDVYTYVDRKGLWQFNEKIFDQMFLDEKAPGPYAEFTEGKRYHMFYSPFYGRDFKHDPVLHTLQKTRCAAGSKAGTKSGRTIIRVAPDVMRGDRGMAAAQRLKALWNQGCDVKIGYTAVSNDVRKVLRASSGRGPVPMRHLVQDFDGDGSFDRYFHLKVISINGKIGGKANTWRTINGSANLSGLATNSDENFGIFHGRKVTLQYQRFIDYWYKNFPVVNGRQAKAAVRAHPDPYENVEMD